MRRVCFTLLRMVIPMYPCPVLLGKREQPPHTPPLLLLLLLQEYPVSSSKMIMRKRIEALVLVALLFIAATYLWGSPAVIVSKIPQQSSITYHDRKDNERIVPRNVTSLQHEQMVLSWKTAMHFMDWSISNHTTCLLCSRQRFLPPLPKDKEQLEQLWECPQQENSDKLSGTQQRKMPSTVIIGAQKGGTTTLSDALFSHPDIVMSARKELHFFSFTFHLLFRDGIPDRQVRIHYQNALTMAVFCFLVYSFAKCLFILVAIFIDFHME